MKQEFSRSDIAVIKRTAASLAPLIAKRDRILKKRFEQQIELDNIQGKINLLNMPIKDMTGYNAEDMVERINGVYTLKFPDTIIPPEMNIQAMEETAAAIDDTAVVDEIETSPAEAPFNPLNQIKEL